METKEITVCNMISSNGHNVPNQFRIAGYDERGYYEIFQSYNSTIIKRQNGKVFIYPYWDYSRTTGKYRNQFLGETKAETLKKIKSEEYVTVGWEYRE